MILFFLAETFTQTVPSTLFPSHKIFHSPGVKVSESVHGRLSGGILFLVKNVIAKHIKQVFVETDNILVLRISRELTGALTDSILVGAYLPPQNSAYYRDTDLSNGVDILHITETLT